MHDLGKLKNIQQWQTIRADVEKAVLRVLGEMPKTRIELQVKTLDEMSFPGYTRKRISYFVDEWERVSAWLFVPDGRDDVPAILCCHQGVPQGKAPPGQSARRHRRQVSLPGRIGRCPYLEIREIGLACQVK